MSINKKIIVFIRYYHGITIKYDKKSFHDDRKCFFYMIVSIFFSEQIWILIK